MAAVIGAHQPHDAFGAFDIAAQPKQVIGGPGGQRPGFGADERRIGAAQQRCGRDRRIADHPDIGHRPAVTHGNCGIVPGFADPAKAAGHRLPTLIGAGQKHPYGHRARHQRTVFIDRRGRQGHDFLGHQMVGIVGKPVVQVHVIGRIGAMVQGARHRVGGVGFIGHPGAMRRADDHFMQACRHMIAFRALAAPPGGDIGQQQGLSGQHLGNTGQKRHQRLRFQDANPQRIDHCYLSGANGGHQARRAQFGCFVQFQRVGPDPIHPPPQHINRGQPLHGAHLECAINHA